MKATHACGENGCRHIAEGWGIIEDGARGDVAVALDLHYRDIHDTQMPWNKTDVAKNAEVSDEVPTYTL